MMRDKLYKILKNAVPALFVMVTFLIALPVLAQTSDSLGVNTLADAGVSLVRGDIYVIIGRIVQVFLGLLGMIAVILILYGGWQWMSAAGDVGKILGAKKTLINAVIGLAIILSSFAISQFIINVITGRGLGGDFAPRNPGSYSQPLSGSLGAGIIGAHTPGRGASVPRNIKIAINFKQAIDEKSVIEDTDNNGVYGNTGDLVNKKTFKLVETSILKQNNNDFKKVASADLVILTGALTPDKKNFVFNPSTLLGDANLQVSYTAFITPDLKKADGSNAFASNFSDGYRWEFVVEPRVDKTPPTLISVVPSKGVNPRNTIIQLNFSEALDPTSASGDFTKVGGGFTNIAMSDTGFLDGSYKISNGFKTVEFVTNNLCGTNSCGGNVYCLPANEIITGLIKSASLSTDPPAALGFPYDGVVDIAGNSFDGNGDGTAGDNFTWQFNTSDQIDLIPPKITKVSPSENAPDVALDAPLEITFDKLMSSYTLNTDNIAITDDVPGPYELWYRIETVGLDSTNQPAVKGVDPVKTMAVVKHGAFADSDPPPAVQYNFYPLVDSKIQDLRQNCFSPSAGPICTPTATQPYCCNGSLSSNACKF